MIIFDLDQTLVDTSPVEALRQARKWGEVMRRVPDLPVFDGITPLLGELHAAGERMAIVTKSPDMVAKAFTERHRWPIDIIVGYHDVRRRKPDPEGLLLALERAAASASGSFHVGDRAEDTVASRAAGVAALGVTWGLTDDADLRASSPDRIFGTVADLRTFLLRR